MVSGTCERIELGLLINRVTYWKCLVLKSVKPIFSHVPGTILFRLGRKKWGKKWFRERVNKLAFGPLSTLYIIENTGCQDY